MTSEQITTQSIPRDFVVVNFYSWQAGVFMLAVVKIPAECVLTHQNELDYFNAFGIHDSPPMPRSEIWDFITTHLKMAIFQSCLLTGQVARPKNEIVPFACSNGEDYYVEFLYNVLESAYSVLGTHQRACLIKHVWLTIPDYYYALREPYLPERPRIDHTSDCFLKDVKTLLYLLSNKNKNSSSVS